MLLVGPFLLSWAWLYGVSCRSPKRVSNFWRPLGKGTPMPLLGNYADLTEYFHVATPHLIRGYADHGIFTIQIPAEKFILPRSRFGGPTIVLANPVLLEEMYRRPEDFNKLLFKHSMLRRINVPNLFISEDDEAERDEAAGVLLPADGMKQFYDIILECTRILTTRFAESEGAAVDIHPVRSQYVHLRSHWPCRLRTKVRRNHEARRV